MAVWYCGMRRDMVCVVYRVVTDKEPEPLNPRNDLHNHSPDGFQWGYGGSGPAQLALAILADATGDGQLAVRYHQAFKFGFITGLTADGWTISREDVLAWLVTVLWDREE